MRIANLDGRLVVVADGGIADIERASSGLFSADPQAVYERWDEFVTWADSASMSIEAPSGPLLAPVPRPRQIFAVGMNYSEHAGEVGSETPTEPMIFTKFTSSITGPQGEIELPAGSVDWEVELVAVVGREAFRVTEENALAHIAGVTVGQDLSERVGQFAGTYPQFSLAKSYAGFTPIGPYVVTLDELDSDLVLTSSVNGDLVQNGHTRDMVFSLKTLVARISAITRMLPGDLIFTGTPSGVGMGRNPPRFLASGDVLVTTISGVGEMSHTFVAMRRQMTVGEVDGR